MTDLSSLIVRLDRIEQFLHQMIAPPVGFDLMAHLPKERWFTSGELWAEAQRRVEAAAVLGQAPEGLPAALAASGIGSPHALGRWLAAREGAGIERGGTERAGVLWWCGFGR